MHTGRNCHPVGIPPIHMYAYKFDELSVNQVVNYSTLNK